VGNYHCRDRYCIPKNKGIAEPNPRAYRLTPSAQGQRSAKGAER
jgi:hypothetical protein